MPKELYETLEDALKEMDTPFRTVEDFMNTQAKEVVEKYEEWKKPNTRRRKE